MHKGSHPCHVVHLLHPILESRLCEFSLLAQQQQMPEPCNERVLGMRIARCLMRWLGSPHSLMQPVLPTFAESEWQQHDGICMDEWVGE